MVIVNTPPILLRKFRFSPPDNSFRISAFEAEVSRFLSWLIRAQLKIGYKVMLGVCRT